MFTTFGGETRGLSRGDPENFRGDIPTRDKDEEVKRDFRGGIQRGIQRKYLDEIGLRIQNMNSEETF